MRNERRVFTGRRRGTPEPEDFVSDHMSRFLNRPQEEVLQYFYHVPLPSDRRYLSLLCRPDCVDIKRAIPSRNKGTPATSA